MNAKVTYRLVVCLIYRPDSQSVDRYISTKAEKNWLVWKCAGTLSDNNEWNAWKKSQLTLKKDKQHMIAITNQTFLFISDNFGHCSCSDILNLKLVWNSKGLKNLGQSCAVIMASKKSVLIQNINRVQETDGQESTIQIKLNIR